MAQNNQTNPLSPDQIGSFLGSLDDKNLQAFSERGVEGLDDDALGRFQMFANPKQVQSDYWANVSKEAGGEPVEGVNVAPEAKGVEALASGMSAVAGAEGLTRIPSMLNSAKNAFSLAKNGIPSIPKTAEELLQMKQGLGQLMADRASKVESMVGGFDNDVANGTKIQNLVNSASQKARTAASNAFEALKESAPNTQMVPQNLLKEVYDQSLDVSQLPPSMQKGPIAKFLTLSQDAMTQPEAAQMSVKQMMALRGDLSQLAAKQSGISGLAGQTTNTGRQAYSLIGALDNDISAASKLPGLEGFNGDYTAAREGWKNFKDTFSNPDIEKIASANPSDVANLAFKSPEALEAVRSAGGEAAVNAVRQSTAKALVDKLSSSSIRDPQSILERVIATKPDEMERLFSPSHVDALRGYAGARQALMNIPEEGVTTSSDPVGLGAALFNKFLPGAAKAAGLGAAYEGGKFIFDRAKK